MTPQERKVIELALEALERNHYYMIDAGLPNQSMLNKNFEAIDTIKETLAQPEQEPVAWLHWTHGPVQLFLNKDEAMLELDRLNREYPVDKYARQMKPLYTAPPPVGFAVIQKPWVGLTDDEIRHIYICTTGWSISDSDPMLVDFAENIGAKLREKNSL